MAENTELTKAEEKKEVAHSNNKVTDYSLGIFGTSDNFIMAMQIECEDRFRIDGLIIRTGEYVAEECKKLAEQLKEFEESEE